MVSKQSSFWKSFTIIRLCAAVLRSGSGLTQTLTLVQLKKPFINPFVKLDDIKLKPFGAQTSYYLESFLNLANSEDKSQKFNGQKLDKGSGWSYCWLAGYLFTCFSRCLAS